jgi:peptide-methionine (S)-S-oxide reductase
MANRATFAAGCFWHVEAEFRGLHGVKSTMVGYTGGTTRTPSYEQVCAGNTGHAEAVQVEFDPALISYKDLLDRFWSIHDPTTLNRQGPDVGQQYRSAIFFHTPEQQAAAIASREQLARSGRLRRPIVTEVVPAQEFFRAEEYHQRYFGKTGRHSCLIPGARAAESKL